MEIHMFQIIPCGIWYYVDQTAKKFHDANVFSLTNWVCFELDLSYNKFASVESRLYFQILSNLKFNLRKADVINRRFILFILIFLNYEQNEFKSIQILHIFYSIQFKFNIYQPMI